MRSPFDKPFGFRSPFGSRGASLTEAAALLATWADSNGGLAVDFTDISSGVTGSTAYGSMKIIDGATPANNWQTTTSLTPFDKLTWTGASLRMCYGSDGVLRYAPHNLMVRSQEFDNASWTKTSVAVSANATTAPDGTTTADLVYPSSSGSDRRITQGVTVNNGMAYENRIYAKYAGIRWVRVSSSSASSSLDEAWFDVQNGVAGTYGANISSTSIVASGDGWYRLTVTEITNKVFGDAIFISLVDADGGTSVTANGTDGVYLWGAQLQALPVHSTDYIATTSSAVYKPRIDYDPSTLAVRGLLVEEARTNLCTYSDDLSNAGWEKNNCTISSNNSNGPDGQALLDLFTLPTGTQSVHLRCPPVTVTATTYAASGFMRAGTWRYLALKIVEYSATDRWITAIIDTQNWTVANTGAGAGGTYVSSAIQSVGGGLYRVSVVGTLASGGTLGAVEIAPAPTSSVPAGNWGRTNVTSAAETFYFGYAQLETGSFATSYIPTTSASVTRATDSVSLATTLFNYGSSAITLFNEAQVGPPTAKNHGLLNCQDTDGDPFVGMRTESSNSRIYGIASDAGFQGLILPTPTVSQNVTFKSAFGASANLFDCAVNGTLGTQDTSGTYPAAQTLRMTGEIAGSGQGQTWYRKILQLPRKLSPTDLQTLTT